MHVLGYVISADVAASTMLPSKVNGKDSAVRLNRCFEHEHTVEWWCKPATPALERQKQEDQE